MLEKLTLQRCVVSAQGQVTPQLGPNDVFVALINPADYKHSLGIAYSDDDPDRARRIGAPDATPRYAGSNPETVSFPLVLDGTGVVPNPGGGPSLSVRTMVERLQAICYRYDGDQHEANVVKLKWGRAFDNFFGRLKELRLDYTLFKPSGEPLRARTQLDFVRFKTQRQSALEARRSSPDMTHVVRVKEGDTLPLLCERIYGDGGRYLEVARFNELVNFRRLVPDTLLRFPPLG
ncbi:MAG: peptidoglycan-binding protein [Geminicoccaceae bacterium]|nr:MAG: peptidoglycan-binding protein [Geminicoccaceae bacterium]